MHSHQFDGHVLQVNLGYQYASVVYMRNFANKWCRMLYRLHAPPAIQSKQ